MNFSSFSFCTLRPPHEFQQVGDAFPAAEHRGDKFADLASGPRHDGGIVIGAPCPAHEHRGRGHLSADRIHPARDRRSAVVAADFNARAQGDRRFDFNAEGDRLGCAVLWFHFCVSRSLS